LTSKLNYFIMNKSKVNIVLYFYISLYAEGFICRDGKLSKAKLLLDFITLIIFFRNQIEYIMSDNS
jgi:hypothetical protein